MRNSYLDKEGYKRGILFLKNNLKVVPKLELMKVYRLITPYYQTENRMFNIVGGLSWAFLFPLVLVGVILTFKKQEFVPLHSALILILLTTLFFYGDHRFRESISPILILYAAYSLNHAIDKISFCPKQIATSGAS